MGITLPAPKDTGPNPDFDNSCQPEPSWGAVDTKRPAAKAERLRHGVRAGRLREA
ncbi:hypothetical protein OHO83_03885 [Streptomyces sp. NBC_00569]|uniref:hypothetical protein n=1 Tax=Streptomyces sp. NBC_00569 TaxID=2975780 RepID=UPI002E821253|nr:hypothetical protein [Streptomyces sp. NBC_00569]WUB91530.1 hypothetical protein OHO83_03885 [Streptomyces sp. NBC_00569]